MKNYQDKTKEELLHELKAVEQKYSALEEFCITGVAEKEKETKIFEQVIRISDEFIRFSDETPDYQKIVQTSLDISGARYAVLNIFDENGLDFTTVAFAGIIENIKRAIDLLGFDVVNKHWKHDPRRAEITRPETITRFGHLNELTSDVITKNVISVLERIFGLGEVFIVKVMKEDKTLGDFTLIFNQGETITNTRLVELYAKQVGMFLDRNATTKILRDSERRHSSMIANISDVIAVVGTNNALKFISPNVEKWFGWKPKDLVGISGWLKVFPYDLERITSEFESLLREDNLSKKIECRVKCKDGSFKRIELTAANFTNDTTVGGFLINFRDITDRKHAEEILKESEERFRNMADTAPVLIWLAGTDTLCSYFNKPWLDFTGRTMEQEMGNGWADGVHPDDFKNCMDAYLKAFAARRTFSMEYRLRNASGEYRWLLDKGVPRFGSDGVFVGYIGSCADITELKNTEQNLLNSKAELKTIYQSAPVMMCVVDDERKVLYANTAFTAFTGIAEDLLKGGHACGIFGCINAHDNEKGCGYGKKCGDCNLKIAIEDTLKTGTGHDNIEYSTTLEQKNGNKRNVTLIGSTAHIKTDTHNKLLLCLYDITERKKMEETLRNLSQAVEQSPVSVVITDIYGNIEYGNPNVCRLTGYSIEELAGKNPRIFKSGHTSDEEYAQLWNTITSGGEWNGEFLNKKKNGELYWESALISPIKNQEGKIIRFLAIKKDITERKRNEELLLKSEESYKNLSRQLESILDHFPGLVFYKDKLNNFIRVNKNLADGFNKKKEELEGVNLNQLYPAEIADQYFQDDLSVIRSGDARLNIEESWETADGLKWVSTSKIPFIDDAGEIRGVIGISMDITERKQVHLELDLKNEQLVKVNAEKDKFFSIIAHDLRAPLSGFMKLTEMMDEELAVMTQQEIQTMVTTMKSSAANVFRLLGNLLEWSRMQSGLRTFNPGPYMLKHIVSESILLLKQAADQKEIAISTAIPEDMKVFADTNMLEGTIRNLISNAVKFTPKGGTIQVSAKTAVGKMVEISVKDNGIGMDAGMLADLFSLESNTNRKGTEGEPSTGLGLIICNDFIKMHGGEMQVESEAGKGSVFRFTVPISTETVLETADNTLISHSSAANRNKKLKVLIAEDDETSQMLISVALKAISNEVIKVSTGDEAVEACRNNPDTDLVLMDIKMPGMDGYEATRQIRHFNTDVIIIAQTAFGSADEKEKALASGCNEYIAKPIEISSLNKLIHNHFENLQTAK